MVGSKRKNASTTNGKAKKSKSSLSKESFLKDIKKLYTEGDRYYDEVRIPCGPLVLNWE